MLRHYRGRARSLVRHRHKKWAVRRLQRAHGDVCSYCGCGFVPGGRRQRTVDHRVARSLGGPNRLRNMVLACLACNAKKKTMGEAEFRACEWLAQRKATLAREAAAA